MVISPWEVKLLTPPKRGDKVKAILGKNYAGDLYGCKGSDLSDKALARLIANVLDVFRSATDRHDAGLMLSEIGSTPGRELDPCIQILKRRVLEMRRAKTKRPQMCKQLSTILQAYVGIGIDTGNG